MISSKIVPLFPTFSWLFAFLILGWRYTSKYKLNNNILILPPFQKEFLLHLKDHQLWDNISQEWLDWSSSIFTAIQYRKWTELLWNLSFICSWYMVSNLVISEVQKKFTNLFGMGGVRNKVNKEYKILVKHSLVSPHFGIFLIVILSPVKNKEY